MSGKTPWRRLWDEIEAAKVHLLAGDALGPNRFFRALRMALEEYGKAVDPEGWDEYGLPIEAGGG